MLFPLPFIWFPSQLPYLVEADRVQDIIYHVPESAKIFADRVQENVPIIAMPASTGGSSSSRDLPVEAPVPLPGPPRRETLEHEPMRRPDDLPRSEEPLVLKGADVPHFGAGDDEIIMAKEPSKEEADKALDSEDEELNPWTPSVRDKLQAESKTLKHALTHFPKNRYCEVCRRAKMTARYHRKRDLEVDPEEAPPLHYGHQLRADNIILGEDLTKGSEGERACLVRYDEYSGALQAFPQTDRTTDANIAALQKFGGTRAHGKALCNVKTDCATEVVEAVKYLGWLPDPGIPNDYYDNAKLERIIRSIKEGVRSIHLKAGFTHDLWPRSVEYFCVARSFSTLAPIHPNERDEVKTENPCLHAMKLQMAVRHSQA